MLEFNESLLSFQTVIPIKIYVSIVVIVFVSLLMRLLTSKDELLEEIKTLKDDLKKSLSEEDANLKCVTKLNTKLNRDHLDDRKYYIDEGLKIIYGNDEQTIKNIVKMNEIDKCQNVKKIKKVTFNDNIDTLEF